MEKLLKNPTFLMVGAGVVSFLVARAILNRMGNKTSSFDGDGSNNFEPTSSASGIQCSCRRADGSYSYKTCRTARTSADCNTCCGHYGFKHEGFGY